jgi:hypothetical protein
MLVKWQQLLLRLLQLLDRFLRMNIGITIMSPQCGFDSSDFILVYHNSAATLLKSRVNGESMVAPYATR